MSAAPPIGPGRLPVQSEAPARTAADAWTWPRAAWAAVVLLALAWPAALLLREAGYFAAHAWDSVRYAAGIDYGESPLLAQAVGWLHGVQAYHNDSRPPFVVGNYTPLFAWVTAAVVAAAGVHMGDGRAVSAAASVVSAAIIGSLVWAVASQASDGERGRMPAAAAAGDVVAGVLGAGVYLSARYVWGWGVLGRVDALALCFSLAGLRCVLGALTARPTPAGSIRWAAAWFVLAIFTRQDAVEGVAAGLAVLLVADRRAARDLVARVALAALAGCALLGLWSRGQFFVHVFLYNINSFSWSTVRGDWGGFLRNDGGAAIAAAGILGALAAWFAAPRGRRAPAALPAAFLTAGLLTSLTVGKIGSSINYYLPFIAGCAWGAGLLAARAARAAVQARAVWAWPAALLAAGLWAWAGSAPPAWAAPIGWAPPVRAALDWLSSPSQTLAHGLNSPGWWGTPTGPPGADWRALIHMIATAPGPVVSEDMSLLVVAGKPIVFQPFELTQAAASGWWNQELFLRRVRTHAYALIILPVNVDEGQAMDGSRWSEQMQAAITYNYTPVTELAGNWVYRPAASG